MSLLDRPLEYVVKVHGGELVAFGLRPSQLQRRCILNDPCWLSPNYLGEKPRFRLTNKQADGFKVEFRQ